jgi:hypothetical protein
MHSTGPIPSHRSVEGGAQEAAASKIITGGGAWLGEDRRRGGAWLGADCCMGGAWPGVGRRRGRHGPDAAGAGGGAGSAQTGAGRAARAGGPPGTRWRSARGQAAWVLPTLAHRHLRSQAQEKNWIGEERRVEREATLFCMMANTGNFDEL